MKTIVGLVLCGLIAQAVGFTGAARGMTRTISARKTLSMNRVFDEAVDKFAKDYPDFYAAGWGPTTKAERWNGRHAMFGWVMLIATGYFKSHGLIPNADVPLDFKEWGTLSLLIGKDTITNERAVILIAHVHALVLSVLSAIAPLSAQDTLLIKKGEEPEPAAGLIPPIEPGLTRNAELLNGRLAMLGITLLVFTSLITGDPVFTVIDKALGGLLL